MMKNLNVIWLELSALHLSCISVGRNSMQNIENVLCKIGYDVVDSLEEPFMVL